MWSRGALLWVEDERDMKTENENFEDEVQIDLLFWKRKKKEQEKTKKSLWHAHSVLQGGLHGGKDNVARHSGPEEETQMDWRRDGRSVQVFGSPDLRVVGRVSMTAADRNMSVPLPTNMTTRDRFQCIFWNLWSWVGCTKWQRGEHQVSLGSGLFMTTSSVQARLITTQGTGWMEGWWWLTQNKPNSYIWRRGTRCYTYSMGYYTPACPGWRHFYSCL